MMSLISSGSHNLHFYDAFPPYVPIFFSSFFLPIYLKWKFHCACIAADHCCLQRRHFKARKSIAKITQKRPDSLFSFSSMKLGVSCKNSSLQNPYLSVEKVFLVEARYSFRVCFSNPGDCKKIHQT